MSVEHTLTDRQTPSGGQGPREVFVEVRTGPDQGLRFELPDGTTTVGTASSCGLRLTDRSVSREHATFERLPGHVRVTDLSSKNGVKYLRAKVKEALVPIGGTLSLGRVELQLVPGAQAVVASTRAGLHGLLGSSLPMRQLYAQLEKLAAGDGTALLRGESGTGKELAARALHQLSDRAKKPFVVFDCAATSHELIESELFGHEKGAFTGADRARPGAVTRAGDGTLFLDEVGELPLELQPKLLRLLESKTYRPVGGNAELRTTARILASTARDLEAMVKAMQFRQDLFFRLAVLVVEVPPLRARLEDVGALAAQFASELSGGDVPLAPATLASLQCHPWPGNVRELRNAVHRAVTLGAWEPARSASQALPSYGELVAAFERDYLKALLSRHPNVSSAAREAKIARSQFYRLLDRHGLRGGASDRDQ